MEYKTYLQIKSKIQRDLDLESEDFIQSDEFLEYTNEGIDVCEAVIHKLGIEDDYFKKEANIALVSGTAEYSLPSDIYMNKIKSIIYSNGTRIYPIMRLRGSQMHERMAEILQSPSTQDAYMYDIRNSSSAGVKLKLYPPAQETHATAVTIYYIRNATKMESNASICDLPEICLNFLYQYLRYRIYEKEGHPNMDSAKADLEQLNKLMMETLENMVPDGDSVLEQDLRLYEDHS